jgi:hypothetical protein
VPELIWSMTGGLQDMRIEHQEEAARWIDTWDNNMSGRIWRCTQARLTPEQIAQCLNASPQTVRNYQTDLHDLMNGKSRRERGTSYGGDCWAARSRKGSRLRHSWNMGGVTRTTAPPSRRASCAGGRSRV